MGIPSVCATLTREHIPASRPDPVSGNRAVSPPATPQRAVQQPTLSPERLSVSEVPRCACDSLVANGSSEAQTRTEKPLLLRQREQPATVISANFQLPRPLDEPCPPRCRMFQRSNLIVLGGFIETRNRL
jgi:hypothetical protein